MPSKILRSTRHALSVDVVSASHILEFGGRRAFATMPKISNEIPAPHHHGITSLRVKYLFKKSFGVLKRMKCGLVPNYRIPS